MKYLLDTHALLWWWTNDAQLSTTARRCIGQEKHQILVSAASAWEIATKYRLGKLSIAEVAVQQFQALIHADGFTHLPMTAAHSLLAGALTQSHRDPFDRMLAAQAQLENIPLITRDPAFADFNINTLW